MNVEQEREALESALREVSETGERLSAALEKGELAEGLKQCVGLAGCLRTACLPPKSYGSLFTASMEHFSKLETYLRQQYSPRNKIGALYNSVQNSPALLPRLYLMVVVGCVYMHVKELGYTLILEDLKEMLKTVQNPLRGIFLRHLFVQMAAARLPHAASVYEAEGYGLEQSLSALLENLHETVKLWSRVQSGRDKIRSK